MADLRFTVFDRFGGHLFELTDVLACTWLQEVNGEDSLTVETRQPLAKGMRLVWMDATGRWHEHAVSSVEEVHGSGDVPVLSAWCELSTCELRGDYVVDKRPGVSTGKASARSAMESALESSRWQVGTVDVAALAGCSMYHESAWDAVRQVVETWGGELEAAYEVDPATGVTGRSLGLRARIGSPIATRRFEWGRDLESIKRTVDETDVVTALYAWGKGEELESGTYGRRIGIAGVTPDGLPYVHDDTALPLWGRADGGHVFGDFVADDCDDPQELYRLALADLKERSAPRVSYTASIVQFGEAGADLAGVGLGDAVHVVDRGFEPPLRVEARAVRIETDLLRPENPTVTLGNFLGDLSDVTRELSKKVSSLQDRSAGWDAVQAASSAYVGAVIAELNSLFASSGGFTTIDPATGITVTDKATPEASAKAVNISGAGLRIANSKTSAGDWDWRTFGTGDGFLADLIVAGTLKAGLITDVTGRNFWNLDTGDMSFSSLAAKEDVDAAIASVVFEYALGDSAESAPASGWSTGTPSWQAGKYVWQRTRTTAVDGTESVSGPTCIQPAKGEQGPKGDDGQDGKDGAQGPAGAPGKDGTSVSILGSYDTLAQLQAAHPSGAVGDGYLVAGDLCVWNGSAWVNVGKIQGPEGVGVSEIANQYYLSTSSATQAGGTWSAEQPAWESGKHIWTRSLVTWSDGTTTSTAPVLAKAINAALSTANAAQTTADAASGTANAAKTAAETAQRLAEANQKMLTQKGVFDLLTNNGELDGFFMQGGELYVNASYLASGVIADKKGLNYWNMETGELHIAALPTGVYYGTCDTAAETAAKAVTVGNFALEKGACVAVRWTYNTSTGTNPVTVDVDQTGAKPLVLGTSQVTGNNIAIRAGRTTMITYTGTQWQVVGDDALLRANTAQGTANTANSTANEAKGTADANAVELQALGTSLSNLKTQEAIFNLLTANGTLKGIYMADGQLYINADYIKTGTLIADRLGNTATRGIVAGDMTLGTSPIQGIGLMDGENLVGSIDYGGNSSNGYGMQIRVKTRDGSYQNVLTSDSMGVRIHTPNPLMATSEDCYLNITPGGIAAKTVLNNGAPLSFVVNSNGAYISNGSTTKWLATF